METEPLCKPFCVKNLISLINDAERLKLIKGVAKKAYVLDNLKYVNLDLHSNQLKDWKIIRPLLSEVIDVIIDDANILSVNRYDANCCDIV